MTTGEACGSVVQLNSFTSTSKISDSVKKEFLRVKGIGLLNIYTSSHVFLVTLEKIFLVS